MRSLTFLPTLSLTLFTLCSLAPTVNAAPVDIKRDYPHRPVAWLSDFRGTIRADTVMELEWTGGSGEWEVYYIPQWPGEAEYAPVDIARTSHTSIKWRTPSIDDYPAGTTFIMVVNDAYSAVGAKWFDTSSLLNFVAE